VRFLLDESADARLIAYLRRSGHDVTRIATEHPAGLPDSDVLALAFRERRTLLTADRDFGDLVFRQRQPHAGVILLRLEDEELATKVSRLEHVLDAFADRLDQFLVVTARSVRLRDR
jgi:predicted nuclease of predicted toxin-antitoxin system